MKKLLALFAVAIMSSCENDTVILQEYLPDGSPRCQAITQEGYQCKRAAEDGSIYCWQHRRMYE